jgi:serine protease Do
VPSNLTKQVVAQLRQYGSARRGWLGVRVDDVDQAIAESFGLKRPEGAIVVEVTEGGPGAAAGLKVGDLITTFNNQRIKEMRDLSRIVAGSQIGAQMSVRYLRGGKPGSTSVKLSQQEEEVEQPSEAPTRTRELSNLLGVDFAPLEDADRRRHRVPASVQGVIVRNVELGSDALGKIEVGDVVTEVNFQPVGDAADALEAAEDARRDGKPVLIQVWRGGEVLFRSVRVK